MATVLTAPEFLEASIKKMYSKQDFDEWLEEMKYSDLRGWARDSICEGLQALNVQCSEKRNLAYYKNNIDKLIEQRTIISFEEMENKLLLLLFETWISDGYKAFRDEIPQRLPEKKRDTRGLRSKVEDYYSEICHEYEDDSHHFK